MQSSQPSSRRKMVSNITWHISLLFSLLAPSVTLPSLPSFNDLKEHTRLPALNSNMHMSLHNSGRGSHREVRRTGHRWWFRDHRVHLSGSGSKRTLGGLFYIPASCPCQPQRVVQTQIIQYARVRQKREGDLQLYALWDLGAISQPLLDLRVLIWKTRSVLWGSNR